MASLVKLIKGGRNLKGGFSGGNVSFSETSCKNSQEMVTRGIQSRVGYEPSLFLGPLAIEVSFQQSP